MIDKDEIIHSKIKLATILRMEQVFQVSRSNLLLRLKELGLMNESQVKAFQAIPVKDSAREYGLSCLCMKLVTRVL